MKVIGRRVDSVSYASATNQIIQWAQSDDSHYVCIANVHVLMEAYDSLKFRNIVSTADLVTPDGMPLVWMMRLKGGQRQGRVYGPTLMLHVLEAAAQNNIAIGFYGGTPKVLDSLIQRMKLRYKGLNVAFCWSPPFRTMNPEEDSILVKRINQSGAKILFVGLGCPKQEIWMSEHREKIKGVMLGVGAAFDFHAGSKPQAPEWMQNIGLEWFFRLLTEPRRLWKRYLYHSPRFIVLAIADLLGLLKTVN